MVAVLGASGVHAGQTAPSLREQALAAEAGQDTAAALAALDKGLKAKPNDAGMLAVKGQVYWRLLRTKSAEQALIAAAKTPAYASEAQYWLGRIYFFKGWQAENAFPGWHEEVSYRPRAMAAFTAARDARPDSYLPYVGLGDIAKAEGREAEANAAYAKAASLGRPPGTPIDRLGELDATLAALQKSPNTPLEELRDAVDARIDFRPDPMAYATGANLLLARRADLAYVARLAEAGRSAGEQFVHQNESSYRLDGKVQASLDRNAAGFADIAGWAAYQQKNITLAETRLAEAARLSRNLDPTNQIHLGELSKGKNDLETAREHYLTVLDLAQAAPPQREASKAALVDIQSKSGEDPADFEKWLSSTLDSRREERRKALVSNMAGKLLPGVVFTDLQGHTVDLLAERGNVVVLNFFSAW